MRFTPEWGFQTGNPGRRRRRASTPTAARATLPIRQGSLRLRLDNGHFLLINVHRQPALRRRQLTPCQIERVLGPYLNQRRLAAC